MRLKLDWESLTPLVVLLTSILFGLRLGLNYGVSNQAQYILPALNSIYPDLLTRDWFTTSTTSYHMVFPYLAVAFLKLTPDGWAFGLANVISATLVGIIVFLILREVVGRKLLLPSFLLTMTLISLTTTAAVGGVYISSWIFQPSSLGALGFLAGLYCFIRGRAGWSGFYLALGGLFHANYLLVAIPVFALAQLMVGSNAIFKRLGLQLALPVLVLILYVPMMWEVAMSPQAPLASHIYVDIRAPHHHDPRFFWKSFLPFLGWLTAGLVLGWKGIRRSPEGRKLGWMFVSLMVPIVIGVALTTVYFSYSVAKAMPWRISPFALLAAQVMGVVGLSAVLTRRMKLAQPSWFWLVLIFGGLGAVVFYHAYKMHFLTPIVLMGLTAASVWLYRSASKLGEKTRTRRLTLIGALACIVALGIPLSGLVGRSNLLRPPDPAETSLYEWTRTTGAEAVFCVPPSMEEFRVRALRAIVVDWKAIPFMPGEIVEWYDRITEICGEEDLHNAEQAEITYHRMDAGRVARLSTRYGIDYVVLRKGMSADFAPSAPVFQNRKYVVFSVPPPDTSTVTASDEVQPDSEFSVDTLSGASNVQTY